MTQAPVRRLAPDSPFPPYSFVPGRFPHPVSDPAGHSFGAVTLAAPALDPERWAENSRYLLGIDLFNAGYYWEAHEAWESLWHACGRTGAPPTFSRDSSSSPQPGSRCAEGRPEGAGGHARAAADLFRRAGLPHEHYLGLPLGELVRFADAIAADPPTAGEPAAPVEIVFHFALRPGQG